MHGAISLHIPPPASPLDPFYFVDAADKRFLCGNPTLPWVRRTKPEVYTNSRPLILSKCLEFNVLRGKLWYQLPGFGLPLAEVISIILKCFQVIIRPDGYGQNFIFIIPERGHFIFFSLE
jgi:hypothetical protein